MHMQPLKPHPFAFGTPLHITPHSGGQPARIMFVAGYEGEAILLRGLGPIAGQDLVINVIHFETLKQTHTVRLATAEDDALIASMLAAIQARQTALTQELTMLSGLTVLLHTL